MCLVQSKNERSKRIYKNVRTSIIHICLVFLAFWFLLTLTSITFATRKKNGISSLYTMTERDESVRATLNVSQRNEIMNKLPTFYYVNGSILEFIYINLYNSDIVLYVIPY